MINDIIPKKKVKEIKKVICSPLSERRYDYEPIIKIYPEYNPRLSLNKLHRGKIK